MKSKHLADNVQKSKETQMSALFIYFIKSMKYKWATTEIMRKLPTLVTVETARSKITFVTCPRASEHYLGDAQTLQWWRIFQLHAMFGMCPWFAKHDKCVWASPCLQNGNATRGLLNLSNALEMLVGILCV